MSPEDEFERDAPTTEDERTKPTLKPEPGQESEPEPESERVAGPSPEPGLPPEPEPAPHRYRLPAEWEPHEATWIAWPRNQDDWPGKFGPIPWVFVEMVRLLSRSEPVRILVGSPKTRDQATALLERAGVDLDQVSFFPCPTDRAWLRDSGPMFLLPDPSAPATAEQTPSVRVVDWKFNAWAKYDNWKRDQRIPRFIAKRLDFKRIRPRAEVNGTQTRVVLEGGAIDVNGRGLLLTTEECLLSDVQERNPGLDRVGYEALFAEFLGITQVIWLEGGIVGDDTHGHIDDVARFVGPSTILTVVERDSNDPNHRVLIENLHRLRNAVDLDGDPLHIVELPMPRPVVFDGTRLPASYANFYIANRVVLVPTFNDPADREALSILGELFPDREVIGVHAVDLVWGLGTIHCLTRDQPRGPVLPRLV